MIRKIIEILDELVSTQWLNSYQYNNAFVANIKLDTKLPSPTAIFYQVTDYDYNLKNSKYRETISINISFLDKESKLDNDGLKQQEIIDRMKDIALQFVQKIESLKDYDIVEDTIKMRSVYLRTDSNRSGINLQISLKEKQPHCL